MAVEHTRFGAKAYESVQFILAVASHHPDEFTDPVSYVLQTQFQYRRLRSHCSLILQNAITRHSGSWHKRFFSLIHVESPRIRQSFSPYSVLQATTADLVARDANDILRYSLPSFRSIILLIMYRRVKIKSLGYFICRASKSNLVFGDTLDVVAM